MFGGPFDIETFRQQQNVCYIMHPPFISYCMLIEERQPIKSIGETTQSQRGTVKGMRRPAPGSVHAEADHFSGPESEGLYSNFLSSDTAKTMTLDEEEPIPKKSRTNKTASKSSEKGLARFMSK